MQRIEPAELLDTVIALTAGAATLMPFFILSMPGIVALGLLVLPLAIPAVALGLAGAVAAAVLAPPFLLVRYSLRRLRRGS